MTTRLITRINDYVKTIKENGLMKKERNATYFLIRHSGEIDKNPAKELAKLKRAIPLVQKRAGNAYSEIGKIMLTMKAYKISVDICAKHTASVNENIFDEAEKFINSLENKGKNEKSVANYIAEIYTIRCMQLLESTNLRSNSYQKHNSRMASEAVELGKKAVEYAEIAHVRAVDVYSAKYALALARAHQIVSHKNELGLKGTQVEEGKFDVGFVLKMKNGEISIPNEKIDSVLKELEHELSSLPKNA